jgi:Mlc titration factor MtfA (ptsG expression regulator)
VLHLGLAWYDDFVGIVVHPDEVVARRETVDDAGVVHQLRRGAGGEAMEQAARDAELARRGRCAGGTAREGYNVVIHEFVHKLDMRDGAPDGCPPLLHRPRPVATGWP